MSNVTAPVPTSYNPKWDEFNFPNQSISPDKWHYSYDDGKSTAKTIEALIPAGTLVTLFFLFSKVGPWSLLPESFTRSDVAGWIYISVFVSFFIASLFLANKVAKRAVASRGRKRDEYRAQNASLIIDELAKKGWKIVGKDAVKILIQDNNPYMVNENGTRYYARQFHIGREDINVMVELSDAEVQKDMKDKEKQSRTEFLINKYETANGTMSPEMKTGFVEALKMSL